MNTDINTQHELLKAALSSTDNYLAVESAAVRSKKATADMLKQFILHYNNAYKALESLGVLNQHEAYMKEHLKVMWSMAKEEDTTLADDPYASAPGGEVGGVEEEFTNEVLDQIVEELTWEDIIDLYEDEELITEEEELLGEKLSAQSRLKKKQAFARGKSKRNVALRMKLHRSSDMQTLRKRAIGAARRALYARILRGRDKSQLSAAEKDRIEQQASRLKNIQDVLVTKMLPKIRSIEQKRLASYRTKR